MIVQEFRENSWKHGWLCTTPNSYNQAIICAAKEPNRFRIVDINTGDVFGVVFDKLIHEDFTEDCSKHLEYTESLSLKSKK